MLPVAYFIYCFCNLVDTEIYFLFLYYQRSFFRFHASCRGARLFGLLFILFFYTYLLHLWCSVFISTNFSLSHSFFDCLHLFLIFVLSILYYIQFFGIICCLLLIPLIISSVIHFFFSCLSWPRMISFADFTTTSFNFL